MNVPPTTSSRVPPLLLLGYNLSRRRRRSTKYFFPRPTSRSHLSKYCGFMASFSFSQFPRCRRCSTDDDYALWIVCEHYFMIEEGPKWVPPKKSVGSLFIFGVRVFFKSPAEKKRKTAIRFLVLTIFMIAVLIFLFYSPEWKWINVTGRP